MEKKDLLDQLDRLARLVQLEKLAKDIGRTDLRMDALRLKADNALERGDVEGAEEILEQARKLGVDSKGVQVEISLAWLRVTKAKALALQDRDADAEKLLRKAWEIFMARGRLAARRRIDQSRPEARTICSHATL